MAEKRLHTIDPARQPEVPVLHVLGGTYMTSGAQHQDIPEGGKRLLVFVALRGGTVNRRYVAGALWPTCSEARSAGNLRSSLWRLRGAGIDLLAVDKWSISLHEQVVVDVWEVAEWATRLVTGAPLADDLTLHPSWWDALDLLPGWYDDWVLMERERIRQRTLHGLEALSRELLRAGRYAEAVDAGLTAVRAEPLRESAHRALLEAHLAEGNWVEARRSLRIYRTMVEHELGVPPSPDLEALLVRPTCRTNHPPTRDADRLGLLSLPS